MKTQDQIPAGYMQNALGHLVPIEQVRESDRLRDESVIKLAFWALKLEKELIALKMMMSQEIADLISISAEQYQVKLGGKEGNVQLHSFDGRYRVERVRAKNISFTEELQAAKQLIDDCITEWADGANGNLLALVNRAFKPNANGEMKTAAVLDLLRLDIEDDKWKRAMEALKDSIQTTGATTYIRVYERVEGSDKYRHINLNIAAV